LHHQQEKIPDTSSIKAVNRQKEPLMNMPLTFKQTGKRLMNEG